MDDCSSLFLWILLAVAAAVGFVRAGRRHKALEDRVESLRRELRDLGRQTAILLRRLEASESATPTEPPAAVADVEAAPEQAVAELRTPSPEPRGAAADRPPAATASAQPAVFSQPTAARPESTAEIVAGAGAAEPAASQEPAARPAPPPPPPPPSRPRFDLDIDWEQWLGLRGAAVVAGIALALAALFFLRYAVEQGFFPPPVRVALGFLAGIGSVATSEVLRRRGYPVTGDALAGSGVVILYAATWAGAVLYGLLPYALAFALMVLVTVACGVLAWRHRSQVIALLGLLGGFATPLLLSSGRDDPLGLFGYVLLLDAGLLWLAHRRRWPVLTLLSLLGTVFYQGLWIFFGMGPRRALLGLGIVAVFAVLFALTGRRSPAAEDDSQGLGRLTGVGGVLLPFVFALYFAFQVEAELDLLPLAALLLLLSLAAEALGRRQGLPLLGLGAAAADLGVVFAWWARGGFEAGPAWKLTTAAVGLTLAFHGFVEWDRRRGRETPAAGTLAATGAATWAAPLAAGGFLALLGVGPFLSWLAHALGATSPSVPPLTPWLAGWVVLAALLTRQAALPGKGPLRVAAAVGLGAGFALFHATFDHVYPGTTDGLLPALFLFALALAGGGAFHALALVGRGRAAPATRRFADIASAAYPGVWLVFLVAEGAEPDPAYLAPGLYLVVSLLFAVLGLLAAVRLPSGGLAFTLMALVAVQHAAWTSWVPQSADPAGVAVLGLVGFAAAVLLFTTLPLVAGRRFAAERWGWYTAALAGPAWFLPLEELWELRFGDAALGLLPLALGALALAAVFSARRRLPAGDPARRRAVVWLAGAALSFAAVAIPLQLEKEWITLGWALQALAVLALWKRLDHPGLKYLGLALAAAVSVRLLLNPELLDYYPRSPRPVFNWLMYTYLVPAAALLGSALLLRPLELERLRPRERGFYLHGKPAGAIGCAVAAILVTFAWINLTVFDAFSTGAAIDFSLQRLPARDLTLSLAWILYALLLLAVGFVRDVAGLRWTGLAFLCLSLGKVFLYDLGELEGLYRVGSLIGLAVSLLLVSLAYQRFLRRPEEGSENQEEKQ